MYRRIRSQSRTKLLLLFLPGIDDFPFDDKDIIPIINTNSDKLISDFNLRVEQSSERDMIYKPQFLLIIDTDEQLE